MPAIGEESQQLHLSDLPDEILIHILSLLPTESAVKTCLFLRNPQQHLWKSLSRLEFTDKSSKYRFGKSEFINFVDKVMNLRDKSVPLTSFSLECYMKRHDTNRVKTWVTNAVQSNIEELTLSVIEDLDNDINTANTPYSCVFGCVSLVKLDLGSITFNVPSSVICLPRLKYLTLKDVRLMDDESTEKLLSSPKLEELIIEDSFWYIRSIYVRSPNLRVLKISDHDYDDYYSAEICIVGESLESFCYTGNLGKEYRICASSSTQLSKVELYVNEEIIEDPGLNFYEILKGLSNTRNLALSDYFLQGLQNFPELLDTIPIFDYLTRLDIRVYKEEIGIDSLALMKIYERCPHMECLNIGKLGKILRGPQLSPIPLCFRTRLKKIIVHYYVPGDESDAALDVLLNSAFVLEELVIYCKWDDDIDSDESGRKIQELQDRLIRRPRISKDCMVLVYVTYANKVSLRSDWYYSNCYLKSMNES